MTVDEYMKLPYHLTMVRDEHDGEVGWVVSVEELPGCISEGDTPEEAATMIQDAMHGWLTVKLEHGDPIPLPRPESTHSGKFMTRVPVGLHAELDKLARSQGVSLNSLVNNLLAGAIGWPAGFLRRQGHDLREVRR